MGLSVDVFYIAYDWWNVSVKMFLEASNRELIQIGLKARRFIYSHN